jgi:C4-type Zn-finger protein
MDMRTSRRGCLQTAMQRFMDLCGHYMRQLMVLEGKSFTHVVEDSFGHSALQSRSMDLTRWIN